MRTLMVTAVMMLLACDAVYAQTPAAKPAQPAPAQPAPAQPAPAAAAPQTPPPAPENYTYQSEGRRDPFLNLLNTGGDARVASRKGEGPSGLSVSDIAVRGVLQSRGSLVAMISGPDNKTYLVHQGDKFLDGTIKTVTPQGLIIVQEVNDPLSLVKQREIRKFLRSVEDVK
jgi:Tfp pilus assembly protein PilP